jgi:hypothetical protein
VSDGPAVDKAVFLNVPYDREYAPLFGALIAGLVALGRIPRCALEAQSEGKARLQHVHGLLASCGSSIHDLSRVTLSGSLSVPRFNMPFELGIAFALAQRTSHRIFTFEEKERRIDASLSDMKAFDPIIHSGTTEGILGGLLDCFDRPGGAPPLRRLSSLARRLAIVSTKAQRDFRRGDPFRRAIFLQLVAAAAAEARRRRLIGE